MITKFEDFINENLFSLDNNVRPYQKIIFDAILAYYKSQYPFNANSISFNMKSKGGGHVPLNVNNQISKKFKLYISSNLGFESMVDFIFHELTHVKQITNGELRIEANEICWKNEYKISISDYNKLVKKGNTAEGYKKYIELPWEKEAVHNENTMAEDFFKSSYFSSLKGKDATIDFIINDFT